MPRWNGRSGAARTHESDLFLRPMCRAHGAEARTFHMLLHAQTSWRRAQLSDSQIKFTEQRAEVEPMQTVFTKKVNWEAGGPDTPSRLSP